MMSRSKSANSLVSLEAGAGGGGNPGSPGGYEYEWRPPASGVREWRQAISTPLAYRLGNSTVHFRPHLVLVLSIIVIALLLLFYSSFGGKKKSRHLPHDNWEHDHFHTGARGKYPLSDVLYSGDIKIFKIAIIADPDQSSKSGDNEWTSYLRYGELRITFDNSKVDISIPEKAVELKSSLGAGGRGMELSELSVYNGKLYTVDDRTGVIYEIIDGKVVPWVILSDGPGNQTKEFKSEWSTVKGDYLWLGGLGKEWTTRDGTILNTHPMFVKKINKRGEVQHIDWEHQYKALRKAINIPDPGYVIHEAVNWSPVHEKWFFLPRRVSKERYDDNEDEKRGSNIMIMADESFTNIEYKTIGEVVPTHGFSSFKFVPGSQDEVIVALKSEEFQGNISTYVMAFNIQGKILLPEVKIADKKYEGIEFV